MTQPVIQVFGLPNDQATRSAQRFFKERRVPISFVDLRKRPIAPGALAPKPAPIVRYRQIVANLAAAEAHHDVPAIARFRGQLDDVLTPALIGTVYQEHERLMAAIAADGRDSHAALLVRQLQALCGPASVKAQLEFCK